MSGQVEASTQTESKQIKSCECRWRSKLLFLKRVFEFRTGLPYRLILGPEQIDLKEYQCKHKSRVWVDINVHDRRVLKCQNKKKRPAAARRQERPARRQTKPIPESSEPAPAAAVVYRRKKRVKIKQQTSNQNLLRSIDIRDSQRRR